MRLCGCRNGMVRRFLLAGAAVLAIVAGHTDRRAAAAGKPAHRATAAKVAYDLYSSYPNFREIAAGNYLTGTNLSLPAAEQSTVLWFELDSGGAFKQFNSPPPQSCHWDQLRWNAAPPGQLVYLATHDGCHGTVTDIGYSPALVFMPRAWTAGQPWSAAGSSQVVYSEGGQAVCRGVNTWSSRVLGSTRLPGGAPAVRTETDEAQTLFAVAGAPPSVACPAGPGATTTWQENFFISSSLQVTRSDGTLAGADSGLARSVGGNVGFLRLTGFQEWDSQFSAWAPLPPPVPPG